MGGTARRSGVCKQRLAGNGWRADGRCDWAARQRQICRLVRGPAGASPAPSSPHLSLAVALLPLLPLQHLAPTRQRLRVRPQRQLPVCLQHSLHLPLVLLLLLPAVVMQPRPPLPTAPPLPVVPLTLAACLLAAALVAARHRRVDAALHSSMLRCEANGCKEQRCRRCRLWAARLGERRSLCPLHRQGDSCAC